MKEDIEIKIAPRFMLRKMHEAVRKSFVKALTEPITNSDDSYTRLENSAVARGEAEFVARPKPIRIYVTRKSKTFEIVDFAEGMTYDEMKTLFSVYGDEKPTHFAGSRSLFGKGLTDVLLSQPYGGLVHSIKDGYCTRATFKRQRTGKRKQEKLRVIFEGRTRATKAQRERYRIPTGNGTHVTFRFKSKSFPQRATLIERLSNFYLLRIINSSPARRVEVIFLTPQGKQDGDIEVLRFSNPGGTLIDTLEKDFHFEKWNLRIEGELFRAEGPLPQKDVGMENRIGGLLVLDENDNVMDLTLFDFDNNAYARRLFGTLRLAGVNQFIRDKLDAHEEVLTDTRDGLSKSHDFYKVLAANLKGWLHKHVQEEKRSQAREKPGIPQEDLERQRKAFDLLNQVYKEVHEKIAGLEMGEEVGDTRPENGMQFDRSHTEIELNRKTYVGLIVDTEVIPAGERISVTSTDDAVEASPSVLVVPEPEPDRTVVGGGIYLRGTELGATGVVQAVHSSTRAKLEVEVVKKVPFTPHWPLQFHSSKSRAKPNRWGKLKLYIDTRVIPVGDLVQLSSSSEDVMVRPTGCSLSKADMTHDDVARVIIEFRGTGDNQKSDIEARVGEHFAMAHVTVASLPPSGVALFKDWQFERIEGWTDQTYFEPDEGIIRVNLDHPLNEMVFGAEPEEASVTLHSNPPGYVYLAELILNECLYFTYSTAYQMGRVQQRLGDVPWQDVRNYITSRKNELGEAFFKDFIPPDILAEIGQLVRQASMEIPAS